MALNGSDVVEARAMRILYIPIWEYVKPVFWPDNVAMNGRIDQRLFDRRLFAAAAIAFPLIVLAGFGRTYYVRGFFNAPPLPSGLVHLHGLLMSAWVVLFVTQVYLISSKEIRLHQRLGYGGVALGALIIATGLPTALRAAKYGSASSPPGV